MTFILMISDEKYEVNDVSEMDRYRESGNIKLNDKKAYAIINFFSCFIIKHSLIYYIINHIGMFLLQLALL